MRYKKRKTTNGLLFLYHLFMTSKQKIQKNYTNTSSKNQLTMSIPLDQWIPYNDSVRLLSLLLEEIDDTLLHQAYSPYGRKSVVPPNVLFKLIIYGFMNQIYSSRALEKACRTHLHFIWLLDGHPVPDHNTIHRFKTQRLTNGVMENLFNQLLLKLHERGEIPFQTLFIDGTKLEANANKYTFGWKGSILKYQAKLRDKMLQFLITYNQTYETNHPVVAKQLNPTFETCLAELSQRIKDQNISFVHGKGQRKHFLQRHHEEAQGYLDKWKLYQETLAIIGDHRNSYSKTDPDATFMRMKEDHMKNGQLKPAYNVQIGVESEYLVGIKLFQCSTDTQTLIPFLEQLKGHLPHLSQAIVADAGYESEENYHYLEEHQLKAYIKPLNYEQMKQKKFKQSLGKRENMTYLKDEDAYLCANEKKLYPIQLKKKATKSGSIKEETIYECESCENCPFKSKCTTAKGNKKLSVSKKFITYREKSLENLKSDEGIILRINRSIQVEGAFGVLKQNMRFKRFFSRGLKNVTLEFYLLAFAYNIQKFHQKNQNDRLSHHLHELKKT